MNYYLYFMKSAQTRKKLRLKYRNLTIRYLIIYDCFIRNIIVKSEIEEYY